MSAASSCLRMARVGDVAAVLERLNLLRESTYYRRLDETGRRRLHTLLPSLLRGMAGGDARPWRSGACCTSSS